MLYRSGSNQLRNFENKITVQENYARQDNLELSEIALKDKHRSRSKFTQVGDKQGKSGLGCKVEQSPSKLSSKSAIKDLSLGNLHVFDSETHRSSRLPGIDVKNDQGSVNGSILSPLCNRFSPETVIKTRRSLHYDNKLNLDELNGREVSESIAILEESADSDDKDLLTSIEIPCSETVSLSTRNIHLTQLVLQNTSSERLKGSSENIDLDDNSQEVWEIQREPIKKNATYKVGLLKRRTSSDGDFTVESGVDDECGMTMEERKGESKDFEVFSGNFYHLPRYVGGPSAIPPQYAPKDERLCDVYVGGTDKESKMYRSPLYGRRSKGISGDSLDFNLFAEEASKDLENLGKRLDNIQSDIKIDKR